MRTRAALGGIFASVTILFIGWQAGAAVRVTSATATTSIATPSSTPTHSPSSAPAAAASAAAPSAKTTTGASPSATPPAAAPVALRSGTFTGSSITTRYGNVRVQISVSSGKITDVIAVHLTDDGRRSVEISAQAAPILRSEVLKSQSSNVATVAGATYTCDAYLTSLQSAIDQAGI